MSNYTKRYPSVAPWDTPGLPDRHYDERCRWHSSSCAYRDDDPARCPLCHASNASGQCTCAPGDGTLTPELLAQALRDGADLSAEKLAAGHDLTPLAASRIRERARQRRDPRIGA